MPELYRGFIPKNENPSSIIESKADINAIVESGDDPHSEKLADKLIWVTPDLNYAKSVVTMRTVIRMSVNDTYYQRALNNQVQLPCVATYEIDSDEPMYDATAKKLVPVSAVDLPNQIVLQQAKPEQVTVSMMSQESFQDLLQVLKAKNMGETLARATMYLDRRVGKKFLGEELSFDDADNMSLREAIKIAFSFYLKVGLDAATVEELLAKGLFSMSSFMGDLAKSCQFRELKKIDV